LTLPEDTPIDGLVDTAKLRWRIERDYEELKNELGLAHFEGRSRRGFHHHATLCLIRELAVIPPSGSRGAKRLAYPPVPDPEAPPIGPGRHTENSITAHGHAGSKPRCAARIAEPFHQNCLIADGRDATKLRTTSVSSIMRCGCRPATAISNPRLLLENSRGAA